MASTPGLPTLLASSMRCLTRAASTSCSQRRRLVVSRDLGPDTMSLLHARGDLDVYVSFTCLIEAIDKLHELSDSSMARGQDM